MCAFSGAGADSFWIVKTIDKKVNVKGSPYLDLVLCNKQGEIPAKLWDYSEAVHGDYKSGDLVKIRGSISQFNGNDQLRVDRIRLATTDDGVDISDYVPSAEYSGEAMLGEIMNIIARVQDEDLKAVTYSILEDNRTLLLYWPAAFKLHHAIRGGLLYHTLSILRMAESICGLYPGIDKDLLICGAAIHDICKIDEFNTSSSGLVSSYSVKGELLGHLIMGAMKIGEKAKEMGISEEKAMLLQHMVISHHGEPEFGAAVRPMFLEAEVLSQLDKLDATIYEISSAVSEVHEGEFTGRQWALDNRKLYNHGRKETTTKAELF